MLIQGISLGPGKGGASPVETGKGKTIRKKFCFGGFGFCNAFVGLTAVPRFSK